MRPDRRILMTILALVASASISLAGDKDRLAGHWAGSIKVPGQELKIDIDLLQKGDAWQGDISIPVQGLKDLPLGAVTVAGPSVSFTIPGIPGDPAFSGQVASDGKTISGDFSQNGHTIAFSIGRGPTGAAAAKEALVGFDEFVEQARKDWLVPGIAIGVVVDEELVYAKGFGERDMEKHLPVSAQTVFPIGSCTKAFTTFTMGTLVDEGKLEWDKPVVTFLPQFKLQNDYASAHITPRDMVTHRSGLPRHDLVWYNNQGLSRKDMVERLRYLQPSKELRETFQYNNLMFLASGYLVEHLTGKTWEEVVQSRILGPLGMTHTNFAVSDSKKTPDYALPYEEKDDVIKLMNFREIDNVGPAGSINSTVEDMSKWITVQLNKGRFAGKSIVGEATLAEMHTPYIVAKGNPEDPEISAGSYGLGWMIDSYRGHYRVYHGGAIDGFIAYVVLLPNDHVGVVAFANADHTILPMLMASHAVDRVLNLPAKDWNGERLAKRKIAEAEQKEAEKKKEMVRKPDTKPAHALEEYAGEYEHPGYGTVKFELKNGGLVVTINHIVTELSHWHYEVFNGLRNPDDHAFEDMKFRFLTNTKGDVDGVAIPIEPAVDEVVFQRKADSRMLDPKYLEQFTGAYSLGGETVTFALQGNSLTASLVGQPLYTLIADRDDEFNLKGLSGFSVRFMKDKDGAMMAAFHQPNGVFEAKRKGN